MRTNSCHLFIYAAQALYVETEMKDLNLQVTLAAQRVVGTRSHPTTPLTTAGNL